MEIFKKVLAQSGYVPTIKIFVQKEGGGVISTGPHKVKVVKAGKGAVNIKNPTTGKDELHVWLYLDEDGQQLRYPIPLQNKDGSLHYLVERMADIEEGETIVMEGKKSQSGMTNYIEIRKVEEKEPEEPVIDIEGKPMKEEEEIEIPIIEEGEGTHGDIPTDPE